MDLRDAQRALDNMTAVLRPILGDGDALKKAAYAAAYAALQLRATAVNETLATIAEAMPKREYAADPANLLKLVLAGERAP